ncbi:type II TA system antitoxin MqsA family protein [Chloroflexota bacterium]
MKNKVMNNLCTNCEKETEMELISREEAIKVRKDSITVPIHYLKCNECGDEVISPTHGEDPFTLAYKQYRQKHGILTPEEIREHRESLGLSQIEFAKLLGLGVATISRYENGSLQDVSHDNLLRLSMDPANILILVEKSDNIFDESRKKALIQCITDLRKSSLSLERAIELILSRDEPSIFNGYTKANLVKLCNAILFLCKEGVWKTKLNKLLFYMDFKHFKEYTVPITGMQYVHMPYGPCPNYYDVILAWLQSEQLLTKNEVTFESGDSGDTYITNRDPDLSVFKSNELDTMGYVKTYFKNFTAGKVTEFSHEEDGYKSTEQGDFIPFESASSLKI